MCIRDSCRLTAGLLGTQQGLLGLALLLQALCLGLGAQPCLLLGLLAPLLLLGPATGLLLGAGLLLRKKPLPLLLGPAPRFLGPLPGLLRLPFGLAALRLLQLAALALLLFGAQLGELLLALALQALLLGLAGGLFLGLAAGLLLGLPPRLLLGLDLGLGQRQHGVEAVPDHGGDRLGLLPGVHDQIAAGVGGGEREESGPHARVELGRLRLQAVRCLGEPLAGGLRRDVQQDGQVRDEPVGGPAVDTGDLGRRQVAAAALVGH